MSNSRSFLSQTTRREFLLATAAVSAAALSAPGLAQSVNDRVRPTAGGVPATALKRRKIPRTDLAVTRLAYGNALLGDDPKNPEFIAKSIRLMQTAYEQGINFFDTADIYGGGRSESALGEMLKQSKGLREKIVIQSKCALRYGAGAEVIDNSGAHIRSAVEASLKRLTTDRLDLLLMHRPDHLVEPAEVAQAFDELHGSGKVRHFGVSNYGPVQYELLQKYVRQPLVTNQIQLGLTHFNVTPHAEPTLYIRGDEGVMTVDYCRLHEIQVQAYSPLRSHNTGVPGFPNLLNPPAERTPEIDRAVQLLDDLAKKYEAGRAAILLAWLLRHPAQIITVIGASKEVHIVENCAADRIELTREEWYGMLAAVTRLLASKPA